MLVFTALQRNIFKPLENSLKLVSICEIDWQPAIWVQKTADLELFASDHVKGQWQKRNQNTDFMTKTFSVPSSLLPKTKEMKESHHIKEKNNKKHKPKRKSKTYRPWKH